MKIRNSCILNREGELFHGTQKMLQGENPDDLYTRLGLNYPKFFKMDALGKLAFLLGEIIFREGDEPREQTAVYAWNQYASWQADSRHLENIRKGEPGPAVFVYTLPNIALGELAIRHKITGETCFFVAPQWDVKAVLEHAEMLLTQSGYTRVVAGWLEAGPHGNAGFLADIVAGEFGDKIHPEQLDTLYQLLHLQHYEYGKHPY